jgi:hypothetical protein
METPQYKKELIESWLKQTFPKKNVWLDSFTATETSCGFGLRSDLSLDVTFQHLYDLSVLLGTKLINLGSSQQLNSGCDTCGHGAESGIEFSIENITTWMSKES